MSDSPLCFCKCGHEAYEHRLNGCNHPGCDCTASEALVLEREIESMRAMINEMSELDTRRMSYTELEAENARLRCELLRERVKTEKLLEAGGSCQAHMSHDDDCARIKDAMAACTCGMQRAYNAYDDARMSCDAAVKEP